MTVILRTGILIAVLAACGGERTPASTRVAGQPAVAQAGTRVASAASPEQRAAAADSARGMVQAFYDWYVPLGQGPASAARYDSVLATRAARFAPALLAE